MYLRAVALNVKPGLLGLTVVVAGHSLLALDRRHGTFSFSRDIVLDPCEVMVALKTKGKSS